MEHDVLQIYQLQVQSMQLLVGLLSSERGRQIVVREATWLQRESAMIFDVAAQVNHVHGSTVAL